MRSWKNVLRYESDVGQELLVRRCEFIERGPYGSSMFKLLSCSQPPVDATPEADMKDANNTLESVLDAMGGDEKHGAAEKVQLP